MTQRVIAIGDIHGCANALRALIEIIHPQSRDTIITLGDCVDRGPDSRGVIDELFSIREKCQLIPLLGNHEEMMLNFVDGKHQPDNWLDVGGAATVRSYSAKSNADDISPEHIEYIRTWGDFFETDSHFFVHGGYEPERRLGEQHWQTMRWQSLKTYVPTAHLSGKTAVVGHSSQKSGEVFDLGYLTCIDTYCWGGKWLTALDTTSGQTWQVDSKGKVRHETAKPRRGKSSSG